MTGRNKLGWALHEACFKAHTSFDNRLDEIYVWIEEALTEARKTFETYVKFLTYLLFTAFETAMPLCMMSCKRLTYCHTVTGCLDK